jgi:hypothetical protein
VVDGFPILLISAHGSDPPSDTTLLIFGLHLSTDFDIFFFHELLQLTSHPHHFIFFESKHFKVMETSELGWKFLDAVTADVELG